MPNIETEAARWAGLQIDLNSKYRAGVVTADHLCRFLNLSQEERDVLVAEKKRSAQPEPMRVAEPNKKFALLADLGFISVPEDHDCKNHLSNFREKHYQEFGIFSNSITDSCFSNPTRVLCSGDVFWVRVFQRITSRLTSSEECIDFLKEQKADLLGAQGAALVFEQKKEELPKGKYSSFDEKRRLWCGDAGRFWLPQIVVTSDGLFTWIVSPFDAYEAHPTFFCFCWQPERGE
jgi:hypothetical protein